MTQPLNRRLATEQHVADELAALPGGTVQSVNGELPDENGDVEVDLRGDVVYLWDSGTSSYVLAAGQSDDGVSPRSFRGGASGAPEAQAGYVAREGDWQIVGA